MARRTSDDLIKFLKPFPKEVQRTALFLRSFVLDSFPDCFELIYDNYNALAVGFAVSDKAGDVFCSFAVYSKYVNFGLNRGSEINDPRRKFRGSGKFYRHLTVEASNKFPKTYVRQLMNEAYRNSLTRLGLKRQMRKGITITKSISPVKRRPK